ncbi:MAG: hypothetical protein AVDCRST_MAG42-902 [uncultured Chthoniobacterales bacterium]|uniref:Uncharacterized protein n=1 Tax=uncultured Chthoniobacterales bacterium TaxID=1836801 RepID=A0A6J4HKX8_9BACT|nr:MAG: hypothetical protein AVDCRST_MAG42-902 [uncultured Chthoniobacterales bacterium]
MISHAYASDRAVAAISWTLNVERWTLDVSDSEAGETFNVQRPTSNVSMAEGSTR